jgi:hypothetical protein
VKTCMNLAGYTMGPLLILSESIVMSIYLCGALPQRARAS